MRSRIFSPGLLLTLSALLGSACVETITLERDAGPDTGPAPMIDAAPGSDAGPSPDAGDGDSGQTGTDAGPAPEAALARFPWNGFTTGSPHVADDAPIVNHPLRPKLIWEASTGAAYYQVQMTRECGVEDFRACAFTDVELDAQSTETTFRPASSLPVSVAIPVGSRYFWRVRACSASDACSAFTEIRYLDVGRDESDFNGDGYADVLVGAYGQDSPEVNEGAAYVYFGSPAGVAPRPSVILDNPLDQAAGRFGAGLSSVGDLNADGYADLVVGAPGQGSNEGSAYVYFGGIAGPSGIPNISLDNPLHQADGRFGRAVDGLSDFNGDGYADFVVGAELQSSPQVRSGSAYLYYGRSVGLGPAPDLSFDNPSPESNLCFAHSVAGGGDLNGDGLPDLVVGLNNACVPESESRPGRVDVFFGRSAGMAVIPQRSLQNVSGQSGAQLGYRVAIIGDLDGDGFSELAASAPREQWGESAMSGRLHLFLGGRQGPLNPPSISINSPTSSTLIAIASAGDVDGDGYEDLLMGDYSGGIVYLHFGSSLPAAAFNDPIAFENPSGQENVRFGFPLSGAADFNADGYDDFWGAAAYEDTPEARAGAVHVYLGKSTRTEGESAVSLLNPLNQSEGYFGAGGYF